MIPPIQIKFQHNFSGPSNSKCDMKIKRKDAIYKIDQSIEDFTKDNKWKYKTRAINEAFANDEHHVAHRADIVKAEALFKSISESIPEEWSN